MSLNNPIPDVNHSANYLVAGIPFVTSSQAPAASGLTNQRVHFPLVTRHITVVNEDASLALRMAFTQNGLSTTAAGNHVNIPKASVFGPIEVRCTDLFFQGVGGVAKFGVVAGLTVVKDSTWVVTGSTGFPGVG
jgi:hypothetical protein